MDEIEKLIKENTDNFSKVIEELKSKRGIKQPDVLEARKQLDPLKHDVFDQTIRPDKKVKIDTEDLDYAGMQSAEGDKVATRTEKVARVALALQKLIIGRAVSFIFGNPVTLNAEIENDNERLVLKATKKVMKDVKEKSINRRVARQMFSCKEVAELWYPVKKENNIYGFNSKFKLRCAIFSPLLGDKLYPYKDSSGDMVAFSREFSIVTNNVTKNYFETYTANFHYQWENSEGDAKLVEGYPKPIEIGKIPVIFGNQPQTEHEDAQNMIDRLEKLLSNFADTNDYHASPKIFTTGRILGFAKKGESGAIIEGDEGATAQYLSWANAPESVKLEIETLLRMIYTITQTPDISFDAVKGIGNVSGVALKLMFMDAHLKVDDHREVFDEYLQRRINVVKAYLGKFNTSFGTVAEDMQIEPEITPYIINDRAAELKIWQDANGGNPVISQKASFQKASLTSDPDADYEQYQAEQDASTQRQNSFVLNEPTPA